MHTQEHPLYGCSTFDFPAKQTRMAKLSSPLLLAACLLLSFAVISAVAKTEKDVTELRVR